MNEVNNIVKNDNTVTPPIGVEDGQAEQTRAYLALQSDLLRTLYRHRCPTSQALADFYLDLLPPAETGAMREHLTECPHCALELEELAQFLAGVNPPAGGC